MLLLAHAGMGSIISALEVGTPTLVLPRRAALGEVNTDHQLATARWLEGRPGIHVCFEEADLPAALDRALASAAAGDAVTRTAPPEFIARVRQFITAA
jgi:UDP-N-acetylglucosamine transferase subunit ALG13